MTSVSPRTPYAVDEIVTGAERAERARLMFEANEGYRLFMKTRNDARTATYQSLERTFDRQWRSKVDASLVQRQVDERNAELVRRQADFESRRSLPAFSRKMTSSHVDATMVDSPPMASSTHPRPFLGTDRPFSVASTRTSLGLGTNKSTSNLMADYYPPPTTPQMLALGCLPPEEPMTTSMGRTSVSSYAPRRSPASPPYGARRSPPASPSPPGTASKREWHESSLHGTMILDDCKGLGEIRHGGWRN